jgi:hypothetical protein
MILKILRNIANVSESVEWYWEDEECLGCYQVSRAHDLEEKQHCIVL